MAQSNENISEIQFRVRIWIKRQCVEVLGSSLGYLSTAMAAMEYMEENMAVMGKKFWKRQ